MTVPQPGSHRIVDRPACTPAAIRAVLAANADHEILLRYDRELDAAFEQARRDQDLTVFVRTVRRWWFEADAWRDPGGQREFLARMDRYQAEGPPPPHQRITREEIRSRYGVWLYRWEADGLAGEQLAGLPHGARLELARFMDAVVIVDPMEYQRSPDEPRKPLRTLYFGPHSEGLVTFLIYSPNDLVLITRIQWLGE